LDVLALFDKNNFGAVIYQYEVKDKSGGMEKGRNDSLN
jgi:hypothetical protein